jgi:Immunity protein Imm1
VIATARWSYEQPARATEADEIARLWTEIEAQAGEPVILVLEAAGAAVHAVIGDETGTVLLYFPTEFEQTAMGALHSVGDCARAERDEWEPSLTAYYFGHPTEFPRWAVVDHDDGRRALAAFCQRPTEPPGTVIWKKD